MFGLDQIDTVLDVVQDSFEAALARWRFSGVPDNPAAWLMQVARNKALNAFKRAGRTQSLSSSAYLGSPDRHFENQLDILLSPDSLKDSQLRLLFTCCHPRLSTRSQVIITLNILCGFGVPEIANALLMQQEAVKKALARSKVSLREMGNILQAPVITRSEERVRTVQLILYLLFNEGYKATRGKEAINDDLCYEAIRLARLLEGDNTVLNCETQALLALMFFNVSRFPARRNMQDEWLTLEEQDRRKWDKVFIEEGFHYLGKATRSEMASRFHIEAIIASVHCTAATFGETDWAAIASLYRRLEQVAPSPVVTLNRLIAESYLDSRDSIVALDELAAGTELKNSFLVPAAKGDVCKRSGDPGQACIYYEQALRLAAAPADRQFLERIILQCRMHPD